MENDVLKNKIAPWQEKGQWYHGVIDGATVAYITEQTDKFILNNIDVGTSFGGIVIGGIRDSNIKILDVKVKLHNYTRASNIQLALTIPCYTYASGGQLISLAPAPALTGTIEFWIFVNYEEN